jgi:hypothetical protein
MAYAVLQMALDAKTKGTPPCKVLRGRSATLLRPKRGFSRAVPFGAALLPSMAVCVSEYATPSILT